MLAFDKQEYLDRIESVKLRMMQFGLDVLIVSDPANMNYLTGYDGWSFYTPQAVVVALAQDEPLCMVRGIDFNGARVTTFLDDNNLIGYPDDYVLATHDTHSVREFCQESFAILDMDFEEFVDYDKRYLRPAEVELLIGNASKARKKLGWVRKYDLNGLIEDMMQSDIHLMKKENYLQIWHGTRQPKAIQ